MCIFLCFCNTCLFQTVCSQILTECICNLFFDKCNQFIFDRNIIFCKAYKCCFYSVASLKSVKCVITESSCDLSCTIRTEVKENNRIIIFNRCNRFPVFNNNGRQNKFICCIFVVRSLDSFRSAYCLLAFTADKCTVCFLDTIPAVITIHSIVTSHNRCNFTYTDFFHLSFQFFYIFFTGCRWCVTSIQEAVYIYFLDALSLCQFQKSVNM